jgi:putative transposase
MLLSLVYPVVRVLLRLLVPHGQGADVRDLEIVVLRHQLNVLRRQVKRPRLRPSDRVFLAAAARRLPRARWERFLVTPTDAAALAPGAGSLEVGALTAGAGRAGRRCRRSCR